MFMGIFWYGVIPKYHKSSLIAVNGYDFFMGNMKHFYDDIDFMIALFFNGLLYNEDIYEIANYLNNKTPDDALAQIVVNGPDDNNNKELFENYLNKLGIKFFVSNRAVAAKIFYYILQDRIDFYKGIRFVDRKVSNYEKITKYVGDDIGIERILGDFYAVDDGDLDDEKKIEAVIEDTIRGMKQYVNEHLVEFPMVNNISKGNKKTVIETEIEKKVKDKALAKGIEAKNHWENQYRMAREKNKNI
jgi:hypothetical protein